MNLTQAQYEFDRKIENAPPWPGPERAAPALSLLDQVVCRRLNRRYPILPTILIGEPGDPRPRAECASFDDDSAYVLVSGGMLDVIDAVLGALVSGANLSTDGRPKIPAVASPAAVDAALDATYQSWGPRWRGERVPIALPAIPEPSAAVLTVLGDSVRLFLLLHEMGHAVLHTSIEATERTHAQELEADQFAFDTALDGYGLPRDRIRTVLAGACLLPRILEALRLLGHKFPDSHPPPGERVAAILARMRQRCDSEFTYFYNVTVAISNGLRMESAERRLLGLTPDHPAVTAESLVATTMGMLIELEKGTPGETLSSAAKVLRDLCNDANAAELERASALARTVFLAPAHEDSDANLIAKIATLYRELAGTLPPKFRYTFLEEP